MNTTKTIAISDTLAALAAYRSDPTDIAAQIELRQCEDQLFLAFSDELRAAKMPNGWMRSIVSRRRVRGSLVSHA